MKNGENYRLAARWIGKRPIESFLLIIGIALGIGATSAGMSLYLHTKQETEALINSTTYREIVVSTREEADEMELPAVPVNADEIAVLTADDLKIRDELGGVEYAFIANKTVFRVAGWGGAGGPGGPPPQGQQGDRTPPEEQPENQESPEEQPGNLTPPEAEQANRFAESELPETDNPAPSFDEFYGYEITPEFFTAHELVPQAGSLFTAGDLEKGRSVMVLGSKLAENLFSDGIAMGREVYHRRELYEITGILEPTGTDYDTMAFAPASIPDMVLSDSRRAQMFFMMNPVSLHFVINEVDRLDEVKADVTAFFEDKYGENTTAVSLPREEAQSTINRNQRISIIILFLAISGLLIADVNVSNILLGRMIRSRRKIGILKAMGAAKRSIFHLFAIEGLILSGGGALAGMGISYLMHRIMSQTIGATGFNLLRLLTGILLAWIITMLLTILPAVQGAKMPAADAMRYE